MPAVLEGVDRRSAIATIVLDVLVTEDVDLPGRVTRYPVEDGTEISDNVTVEAETLRLGGMVALADAAAIESGRTAAGSRMVDVVEALRKLRRDRALVSCSTGQMLYRDYAFESLRATRSADGSGGNWLSVEAELVKITKVQLATAEVPERAQGDAAGRTGQTNKAAGRNGTAANRSAAKSTATGQQQAAPRKSLAASGSDALRDKASDVHKQLSGLGRNMGVVPVP